VADKALPAFDANVSFIRERNELSFAQLFQLVAGINADGTFENRDAVPTRVNLLWLCIDRYDNEVWMMLSSVATVAFDLKQHDLDPLRRYLFDFNKDFFHLIFLSLGDCLDS
jgi:hypothetical protein